MEMPLEGFKDSAVVTNSASEIANANQPKMRLLLVHHKTSDFPQTDYEGAAWTTSHARDGSEIFGSRLFFRKAIGRTRECPDWADRFDMGWHARRGLDEHAGAFFRRFADAGVCAIGRIADQQVDLPRLIEAEKREDEAARKANQPLPRHDWHPNAGSWQPAALFNGMVAPALVFRIKGAIWYQGESNSGPERANLYEKILRRSLRIGAVTGAKETSRFCSCRSQISNRVRKRRGPSFARRSAER